MISDVELAGMQAAMAESYDDVAEVRRPLPPERRRDRSGGSLAPEPDLVATVPGRLTRGFAPAREQQVAAALASITSAIWACAPDADIRSSDRLIVTNVPHPEWPAVTLEVVSPEVRRTLPIEQVISCNVIGGAPPPPVVPLQT